MKRKLICLPLIISLLLTGTASYAGGPSAGLKEYYYEADYDKDGEIDFISDRISVTDTEVTANLTENGLYHFYFVDMAGNISDDFIYEEKMIDRENPDIEISYTTDWVKELPVTITASDNMSLYEYCVSTAEEIIESDYFDFYSTKVVNGELVNEPEPVSEIINLGIEKNGEYEVTVTDLIGNEYSKSFTVTNIDNISPQIIDSGSTYAYFTDGAAHVKKCWFLIKDEGSGFKDFNIVLKSIKNNYQSSSVNNYQSSSGNNGLNISVPVTKTETSEGTKVEFTLTTNGTYKYECSDNLGNTKTETLTEEGLLDLLEVKVEDKSNDKLLGTHIGYAFVGTTVKATSLYTSESIESGAPIYLDVSENDYTGYKLTKSPSIEVKPYATNTITRKYEPVRYKVIWLDDSGKQLKKMDVPCNSKLPKVEATKTGFEKDGYSYSYKFEYWTINGEKVPENYKVTAPITLKPKFKEVKVKIEVKEDEPEIIEKIIEVIKPEKKTEPVKPEPAKEETYSLISYSVDGEILKVEKITQDVEISLKVNKTGSDATYIFKGWKDANGNIITHVPVGKDVTLYADFETITTKEFTPKEIPETITEEIPVGEPIVRDSGIYQFTAEPKTKVINYVWLLTGILCGLVLVILILLIFIRREKNEV